MTTTATIRRSPRLARTATAVIAATVVITAAYQAAETRFGADSADLLQPTFRQESTPAASLSPAAIGVDPFQAMPDLTPVVSAQIAAKDATAHPFQVMSDLTPVVSAHIDRSAGPTDPFDVMADLTPFVSSHVGVGFS